MTTRRVMVVARPRILYRRRQALWICARRARVCEPVASFWRIMALICSPALPSLHALDGDGAGKKISPGTHDRRTAASPTSKGSGGDDKPNKHLKNCQRKPRPKEQTAFLFSPILPGQGPRIPAISTPLSPPSGTRWTDSEAGQASPWA